MQTYKYMVRDTGRGWGAGVESLGINRARSGTGQVPARGKMTGNLGMAGLGEAGEGVVREDRSRQGPD